MDCRVAPLQLKQKGMEKRREKLIDGEEDQREVAGMKNPCERKLKNSRKKIEWNLSLDSQKDEEPSEEW